MDHAGLDPRAGHQPRVTEDIPHAVVLAERVRYELGDPLRTGSTHQLREQVRADSVTLPIAGDDKGDLGVVSAPEAVEATHRDELGAVQRHQRLPIMMIDVGEALDLCRRQVRVHGEEAQPRGLLRQPFMEVDQRVAVRG